MTWNFETSPCSESVSWATTDWWTVAGHEHEHLIQHSTFRSVITKLRTPEDDVGRFQYHFTKRT